MREITKERIKMLEKNSEYHREFMVTVSENLNMLLNHLGLRVVTVQQHQVIKPLCEGDKLRKETGK